MTRALLHITGEDAASFLQGLITNDMHLLGSTDALFAAMLSPQGKWQHDFFIAPYEGGYALDHLAPHSAALQQKLKLYKLRARVNIALLPKFSLAYVPDILHCSNLCFADSRHTAMPNRCWSTIPPKNALSDVEYLSIRLAHGIPEGGVDVTENDTAMDAGFDMLHGISFTKGCYVGQEVTARMHYKDIARKGFFTVHADAPFFPCPLTNRDGKEVARMYSAYETIGLAYGRFEDLPVGDVFYAGTTPVRLQVPEWMKEKHAKHIAS